MKTNDQVVRFLSRHGLNDDDWLLVIEFYRRNGFKGIRRAVSPKDTISFSDFMEWYENGYGSGDIVTFDNNTGILGEHDGQAATIIAHMETDGKLNTNKIRVESFQMADEKDAAALNGCLKRNMLYFSVKHCSLVRRYVPRAKDKACYSYNGESGYLLAWETSKENIYTSYVLVDGKIIPDVVLPVKETDFSSIDRKGIKLMDDTLKLNGFVLDKNTGKLIKTIPRAKTGETYWYITDMFTLSSDTERNKPANKVRHDRGNYFTDYEEAFDFLMKILEMRKVKNRED